MNCTAKHGQILEHRRVYIHAFELALLSTFAYQAVRLSNANLSGAE